ncbi:MAG: transcriptional regulator [Candidatus Melainabacteria bacterium]|nr:MAG: transcriptional regulator [Candidatus Melainabacteria bacterium]
MISHTAEYALRAIVFLAMNKNTAFTTKQIAAATKVPPAYLSKVMQALVRANLVQSQRGCGGGFALAKPPSEITALEILQAVDPIERIRTCPLGLESHGSNLCALHKKIDDATAIIEKSFAETNIEDILAQPTPSVPLCERATQCHQVSEQVSG